MPAAKRSGIDDLREGSSFSRVMFSAGKRGPATPKRKPKEIPPEVIQANQRLKRGLMVVFSDPNLRPGNFDPNAFLAEVDGVMADPANWDTIIRFQTEVEQTVREFVMPPQPSDADIDRALDILDKFIVRGLVEIGRLPFFFAGMASGAVITTVRLDPEKSAAVPAAYARLRMELLGINTSMPPPQQPPKP